MSKKRNGLNVGTDLNGIFSVEDSKNPIVVNPKSALSIEKALEIIVKQMRASGLRERTVHDYETYVNDFVRKTDIEYLLAIDADAIYEWLGQMKVKDTTKRVPFPPTSDYFAYEVYKRYASEANQFLLGYAGILVKTGRYFDVDETPKLREWIDAFEVAGNCNDVLLGCTCVMTAYHLKQAIQGGAGSAIASAASILSIAKETYRPHEDEMERLDYGGDYDAYVTQKMEEYKQWLN